MDRYTFRPIDPIGLVFFGAINVQSWKLPRNLRSGRTHVSRSNENLSI